MFHPWTQSDFNFTDTQVSTFQDQSARSCTTKDRLGWLDIVLTPAGWLGCLVIATGR